MTIPGDHCKTDDGILAVYAGKLDGRHIVTTQSLDATFTWSNNRTFAGATSLRDGRFNSARLSSNNLVKYCSMIGSGWYLPAIDELGLLYKNRFSIVFRPITLWSSTEKDRDIAYVMDHGTYRDGGKIYAFDVRCVKSIT